MSYLILMFFSCLVTFEDGENRTAITFEQAQTTKSFSNKTPLTSSGKILVMKDEIILGHGSGNYFRIGKHRFILTAAHVVTDSDTVFLDDGDNYVAADVMHIDSKLDIAILVPKHEMKNSTAIEYRPNNKKDLTGLSVVYAGYPADLEKSIFNGMISSCSYNNFSMQSFALPGASGSVIFDNSGRVLGVLTAIKMSYNALSPFPQMHPALVYVTRINYYSRKSIRELLVKWKASK